jgi:hypothetical protein
MISSEEAAMTITTATQRHWFTSHVQSLMSTIMDEPATLDAAGDIAIHGDTARGWVRPDGHEPWGVLIWAVAAHGVPIRIGTLREINDINLGELAIKAAIDKTGVVYLSYRLLADAVTEDNLRAAIHRVIAVADHLGPMLATVYGGQTSIPLEPSATDA